MPKPENPVYNWTRQPRDHRDLLYAAPHRSMKFPAELKLPKTAPILDQKNLGSCVAHGITGAFMTGELKEGITLWTPSRLALYYNARKIEHHESTDSGAFVRDGFKAANLYGLGPESLWPYDTSKFNVEPPASYALSAMKNRIRYYASLDNFSIDNLKLPIYHGNPFVFGFDVYQNFEDYTSGVLEEPSPYARRLGGHCVYAIGYSDPRQAFLIANSWGPDWGENGCFWMSYNYITSSLADDFWVLRPS